MVITQCFVAMSSLNVNRNLHKVVYTKLEKYSAEVLTDYSQKSKGPAENMHQEYIAINLPEGQYLFKDFTKSNIGRTDHYIVKLFL